MIAFLVNFVNVLCYLFYGFGMLSSTTLFLDGPLKPYLPKGMHQCSFNEMLSKDKNDKSCQSMLKDLNPSSVAFLDEMHLTWALFTIFAAVVILMFMSAGRMRMASFASVVVGGFTLILFYNNMKLAPVALKGVKNVDNIMSGLHDAVKLVTGLTVACGVAFVTSGFGATPTETKPNKK